MGQPETVKPVAAGAANRLQDTDRHPGTIPETDSSQSDDGQRPAKHPVTVAVFAKNSREKIRVAIDQFRGVDLVDVRVLAQGNDPSGLDIPTKKGIALRIQQLPQLLAALTEAEAEARRLGLLVDGAA